MMTTRTTAKFNLAGSSGLQVLRPAQFGNIFRASLILALLSVCAAAEISAASAQKTRQPDFLIVATVFNDRGFSVPGASVRARRANETKWRWETNSGSQGEFELHIPENAQYVLRVDAKGYQTLTQDVDATQDDRADLALHLVPLGGSKSE